MKLKINDNHSFLDRDAEQLNRFEQKEELTIQDIEEMAKLSFPITIIDCVDNMLIVDHPHAY
jgi:hypothetical protein